MFLRRASRMSLFILGCAAILMMSACAPAATPQPVEVTRVVQQTVVVTQVVSVVITATPLPATPTPMPSPTPLPPTATPAQTTVAGQATKAPAGTALTPTAKAGQQPAATLDPKATAQPAASVDTKNMGPVTVSAYCVPPETYYPSNVELPVTNPPANARIAKVADKSVDVTIPGTFCVFAYKLDQPAKNFELRLFQSSSQSAFLTVPLTPTSADPNLGFARVKHEMVVNPPAYRVELRMSLFTTDGKEVRSDTLNVIRPYPAKCWDGSWPEPLTYRCPVDDQ